MKANNGGIPTTTASTAAVDALKALGVSKISLATPYPEALTKVQENFLRGNGLEVLHSTWIREKTGLSSELGPEKVHGLALEANWKESEAVFISCVTLHTAKLIQTLEKELMKPVITSSQVTMWRLLRLAGVNAKLKGFGQLFQI
jgi:maleate isomerase